MYFDSHYQQIATCILLSFICCDSAFTATITAELRQGDDENKGIYRGDENSPLQHIFHLTSTKRYMREDRTAPTSYPVEYAKDSLEVHRTPTGRNQFPDSRRELCSEPERTGLFCELDSNRSAADTTEFSVSCINSVSPNSSHGRRESDDTVTEMPQGYSTVVLNDFTNTAFRVVKKDSETPPPEYAKKIHSLINCRKKFF
ncbi:hypothetical protein AVEN_236338-1 [Araneus ventricosus]|uniref:Uncharacterized protein n=1 Tax=Araneus ventricosus TaxID=182803 RepID=A0A4Y2QWB1_ARAVE|nr:hypothetical protein AVEN_236338-1 [Araneus ventricosus]